MRFNISPQLGRQYDFGTTQFMHVFPNQCLNIVWQFAQQVRSHDSVEYSRPSCPHFNRLCYVSGRFFLTPIH